MSDFNKQVIKEFRGNQGIVGGPFEGMDLLLLHNTGARSGLPRINPVVYFKDGDDYVVAASKGGAPTHPDWFFNLKANSQVIVEVGEEKFTARALAAEEPERSELYSKLCERYPMFLEYQKNTSRVIPVIKLSRF